MISSPPSVTTVSSMSTSGHVGKAPTTPQAGSGFYPDFGLSALSSLTQIAKFSQTNKDNQAAAAATLLSATNTHTLPPTNSLAQSLTNQNLASLGAMSLEAFKQVYS